jgi:hypothetical protein
MKQDFTIWCNNWANHEEPIKLLITKIISNELEHQQTLFMKCSVCNTELEISHKLEFD